MLKLKVIAFLPVFLCLGWFSTQASVSNTNWTNTSGGDFSNGSNWNFGVPNTSVVGEFDLGSSYTVSFSSSPTVHSLEVENDFVTFDLSTNTLTLNNSLSLAHNDEDTATLLIKNGTVNASSLDTSSNFNSTYSQLDIGDGVSSTGILNITNTADIGVDGPSIVNVYNTGSIFTANDLNIGINEFGLVDIIDGGLVEVINTSTLTLGVNSGSDGKFAIDGAGSQLHMGTQVSQPSERVRSLSEMPGREPSTSIIPLLLLSMRL